MATYYKGTLYLNSELNKNWLFCFFRNFLSTMIDCSDKIEQRYLKLNDYEKRAIERYLGRYCANGVIHEIHDENICVILDKIFCDYRIHEQKDKHIEIIFEKFNDESGIEYGKEFYTGLIFPISQNNDFVERKYIVKEIFNSWTTDCKYSLQIVDSFKFPCLDLCEVLISDDGIANQNEVLEYQNRFSKGFGRNKKRREFENTIREWYNKNVYNKEIVPCIEEPVKKEDRVSQSGETKVMASIEYLLTQMEKVNLDLYNKYQKEYEELLNGLNDEMGLKVIPSTLLAFHSLEASIKVDLFSIKHNANNILEYLTNLQKEYLVNILTDNEKETSITFRELEKINELFLKAKSHYGLLEQRNVLKKIAFLYLIELIENIDNIDELDLENSYFVDNLNNILVHIEVLRKLGIIKCNVLIDLNDELDIKNVLEIIKTIEFNKYSKEESLLLVKKL